VITLAIADDHPLVRVALKNVIQGEPDIHVIGEASSFEEARSLINSQKPSVTLLDLRLGNRFTFELIEVFATETNILVITMHEELVYAITALKRGAKGFIHKTEPPEAVLKAIRKVAKAESYLSEALRDQVIQIHFKSDSKKVGVDALSYRELEVFYMLGDGLTTKEISEKMRISPKTTETHRQRIKEKLGCDSGNALIAMASKWLATGTFGEPDKSG